MPRKKLSAAVLAAHKVKQEQNDREAMKGFIDDFEEEESDEEEMREWMAAQKEKHKSEADIAEEKYNAKMEVERQEALKEYKRAADQKIQQAKAAIRLAKKKAEAHGQAQVDKVYATYSTAMRNGDFETMYDMIDKVGISINWEDSYGRTAIITACKYGLKKPIDSLIALGADINQENQYGQTPLIVACKGGFGNIVSHLLLDPKHPDELRAVANAKNKFNKTAIDYAFKAGHGKKIIPLLQASIELRLKLERSMGFEVDEEAYQAALTFNFEDKGRVKQLKKYQKKRNGNAFTRLRKQLGLESQKTIERLHQLRDESARKIQGAIRMSWAKQTMSNRMKEIVVAAHRKMLMDRKKNTFVVKIQRKYRFKLARRYWRKQIVRYKAATKMCNVVRMFVARRYYLRALEMRNALARVDQAATMIQCQARRMKAKLRASMLRAARVAAYKIQRFSKIVAAKRKARHRRWDRDRHAILDELYKTAIEVKYLVIFDELKDEMVAIRQIQTWAKALLFNWASRIDWNVIKQLRDLAATKIQNMARERKSKKTLAMLKGKRKKHLAGLPDLISVMKLKGSGNHAFRVGSKHKYGYCGMCDCEKFRPPEPMKPLMCGCGHFITRHVIGYFRDPRQVDYYEPTKSRRKLMGRSFSAATGILTNFDIVLSMKPKDLRKSLASTQSVPPPMTGGEDIKDPGEAARAQFLIESAALRKRKDKAKRAKLFDPIRTLGLTVSSMEKKNPIAKKRREKEAKLKIATTMARNKQLDVWRAQAEEFTGERVSTAEFERVRNEYVKRDEAGLSLASSSSTSHKSPAKTTTGPTTQVQQQHSPATVTGAVLWRVPGEVPLMEPSSNSPGQRKNHTLTLIEQLEKEIELTKKRAENHRSNIAQIKIEEKRARKDARKAKLEYEKSATVLLLKNRLGEETKETTHDKLLQMHTQTVDDQKAELLEELNRISRKAYGLDNGTAETTKGHHPQETSTKNNTTKKRKADALMGKATSAALHKHRVHGIGATDQHSATKMPNIHAPPQLKQDVEELVIPPMVAASQTTRHRRLVKKGRRNAKKTNPAKSPVAGPSVPTADMVMSALKGMLKGIERPDRTQNRWVRTPETDTNRREQKQRSPLSSGAEDEYEDDVDFVNLHDQSSKGHYRGGEREDKATPGLGEDDSFLDQRAETPLEHVAWRQSHAQRAPVVFLHLVAHNKSLSASDSSFPTSIGLKAGRTFVGRDGRSCDVMMDSAKQPKMMSKVHACFWVRRKGSKWVVECADCNSTNGTHVNGRKISSNGRKRINIGATVLFGKRSRKEEMRSELLYVLTDDSTGIPHQKDKASAHTQGRGERSKGRRSSANMYVPPQSPLNDTNGNGSRWKQHGGERKQDRGLEELNPRQNTHAQERNKKRMGTSKEEKEENTLNKLGDQDILLDVSPLRRHTPPRRSSSMTDLNSSLSIPRRRSLLSRERSVQQEENFSNMMEELSVASAELRRPPTTPLRKRRSSLSRGGGIRASVENPGMEVL